MNSQSEFDFSGQGSDTGYDGWVAGRRLAAHDLALRLGLPLGHRVEVWLVGGIRLTGTLRLKGEFLFIEEDHVRHMELVIDHVPFVYRELESCVRLD